VIAVIFEVWPAEGRKQEYLDIAAELRLLLAQSHSTTSYMVRQLRLGAGKCPRLALSTWKKVRYKSGTHYPSHPPLGHGKIEHLCLSR
jgi:hypothetical protein